MGGEDRNRVKMLEGAVVSVTVCGELITDEAEEGSGAAPPFSRWFNFLLKLSIALGNWN